MIAAALLMMATASVQTPGAAEAQIVVLGRKLDQWRGDWRINKGQFSCRTTRSSGDREIDAIGCGAMERCFAPQIPSLRAIAEAKLRKNEKRKRMDALIQSAVPCLGDAREAAIAELAAREQAR